MSNRTTPCREKPALDREQALREDRTRRRCAQGVEEALRLMQDGECLGPAERRGDTIVLPIVSVDEHEAAREKA